MSIRITQYDTQGYSSRTAKPTRSRSEARFEVREGKPFFNHINSKTTSQVEPAETHCKTKTKTILRTNEKTIKFTKSSGHVASASIRHGCEGRSSQGHISSTIHYIGSPKNNRARKDNDNDRLVSEASRTVIRIGKYAMADCDRNTSEIPGIPQDVQADPSSQTNERNAIKLFPASLKLSKHEKNLAGSSSLSTSNQSVRTEPGCNIIVSSHKQPTCKQPQRLRVKGHSGSNIQRNADTQCHPSKTDRYDSHSEPKSRNDNERSEYDYPLAESQQTGHLSNVIVRTKGQRNENISNECRATGMTQYDKQEQFSRQTHYKHPSLGSTSDASQCTFTDSGSDNLELSSSSDGDVRSPSPGLPRSHTNSPKRRKRVKRKGSSKSIDSSMYGDDNTTDGESATDTLARVHERRSRKKDEETTLNSSTRQCSRSKTSLSGISVNTIKGAQFRSSSLTSVSSAESGKLTSATSSPLLTPRGPTLVKKIQIQSFSSSYTGFTKDNKENQPKRISSSEEHFSARIRERSLVPDHPRSSTYKGNSERSSITRTTTPPSKGRPFALRSKPFQLKRSSSKESPCTSESEGTGTPLSARAREDSDSTASNIVPVFTDKPGINIPHVSPEPAVVPSSLPSNLSSFIVGSHYSVSGLEDEVFGGTFSASDSHKASNRDELPVFESTLDDTAVSLMETTQASVGQVSDAITIPCSSPSESDQWMAHAYPPLPSYSYDDDSFTGSHYGFKSLSIVNEQDEMDFTQPPNITENIPHSKNNNNTGKNFLSSPARAEKWNSSHDLEKNDSKRPDPPPSPVRRPSYIKAQQNMDDFTLSLFHSFDDQVRQPTSMETSFSGTEDDDYTEDYDPKEVLRSFSGSNLAENVALTTIQKGGDLITFDDENTMKASTRESSGEPMVKKRKQKIARPKIPTIFSLETTKELVLEEELSNDDSSSEQHPVVRAREETMGQDSMDEKCDTISLVSKEEEFDMIEGSKRNTLVAIDSDDGSTPKARHSPEPDDSYLITSDKDMRTQPPPPKEDQTTTKNSNPALSLPEITTDLYDDNDDGIINDESNSKIPLKKVDTIFDLSGDESPKLGFQEYQDNQSIESFESQSESTSPSNSQMNLDKYSMTTSGFSEIGDELTDSGEIPTEEISRLGPSKTNSDAWRSQSDPTGRTNGAGAPLSDTIAEATELTNFRNSNSAPNLITEKVKKEEALLAERITSSHPERPSITRTRSSPSSLPKQTLQDINNARSKTVRSKDDSHAKLSTDSIYQLDVLKSPQKVNSAPTTPTLSRKQMYPGTFSAEKTQMKLAKLAVAAMEPIYETPLTELVKPLPEPVKLERKVVSVMEGSERPPVTGLQDSKSTKDKLQPKAPPKSKHDIKRHVVQNLLDTEQSYVQNLQYIVSAYYKPLKRPENANIVDSAQVDEMFYQISDILLCHEFFLEQLESRVSDWHDKQKIGDILVASFTKCFLMDAYSAFISHFLHARAAVRIATVSRPGFQRFIEQCCREHKEKLTLQDLMIMPVQRIPRYVLILKDMIKHTTQDHPDYGSLLLALGEIKTLADRMNRGEKEVNEAEIEADRLRDIEASIEGITELVLPKRRFLRKDLAAEVRGSITKKDRCLFLFTDLLVCASVKRKPNALRRGSLSLFSGQSGSEFNKHKLLWKMPLEYMELVKSSPEMQRRNSLEKQLERLENDMSVLSQISSLTDSLNVGHQALDSSIREMMNEVSRQIAEKQIPMHHSLNTKIELQAQTEEGLENFVFLFLDVEIKNTWEAYFENAKQKLAYAKDTFPPEFQYPIPITKTRSGMQFTCSSPSQVPHMLDRGNHCGSGDVWVCNSDGYVGQVCILSMGEQIQPVASLSVCSSRILCISPVPGTKLVGLQNANAENDSKSDTRSLGNNSDTSYKVPTQKLSTGYSSDDDHNAQTIMAFDSSSDDEEGMNNDGFIENKFGRNSPIFDGRLSPEGSSLGTIDGEMDSSHDDDSEIGESEDEENKVKASHRHSKRRDSALTTGSVTSADDKLSLSDIVAYETDEGSTVWLGTEDGSIFVYPVLDAHQKKTKMKIQHQASVQCVLYVDNQVFVSLGNGDLCIYRRQPGSAWEVGAPITLQVGASAAVSCMTAVHGRLWCGCQCNAVIYNTTTLKIETQFNCSLDKDRSVYRMVSTGMGVWLSLQSSAVIRLFHATRYECLADVDVAPPVHKMLAGSDAIIRQHKAACLRVTSLLTCKDLLWIGTSAGVVLTLPMPTITATTSPLRNSPNATASYHGHTGHVRFLTAVEVPKEGTQESTSDKESMTPLSSSAPSSGHSLTPGGASGNTLTRDILIISGGDGYEDFKTSSTSESAGRDDSTNHLLIWRV